MTTPGRMRPRVDPRRRPRRSGSVGAYEFRPRSGTGARTLEELIVATMDDLVNEGSAACPVCSDQRLGPAGCAGCGTRLS